MSAEVNNVCEGEGKCSRMTPANDACDAYGPDNDYVRKGRHVPTNTHGLDPLLRPGRLVTIMVFPRMTPTKDADDA